MLNDRKGTFHDLNALLVFGAFTVLLIHILGFFVENQGEYPGNGELEAISLILLRFGRTLFVFATGMLMLYWYQKRQMDWAAFWRKRWRVIVLPYMLWTAIFTAFRLQSVDPVEVAPPFFHSLFTGSSFYHLYYIPLYLQLNLLFFLTKPFLERFLHMKMVVLLFVGQVSVYLFYHYLFIRPVWAIDWSENLFLSIVSHSYVAGQNYVHMYVFIYALGAYAGMNVDKWRAWTNRLKYIAFGLTLLSGTWIVSSYVTGSKSYLESLNIFEPVYLVYSVSFLISLYPLSRYAGRLPMLGKWLSQLAKQNMALYLVHPLILFLLESYVIFRLHWPTPLLMVVMFLVTPPLSIFLYQQTLLSFRRRGSRPRQKRAYRMEAHKV